MNAEYAAMRHALAQARDPEAPPPMPADVRAVRCPWCSAAPWQPCIIRVRHSEFPLRRSPGHPARYRAAGHMDPRPNPPAGAWSAQRPSRLVADTPGPPEAANRRFGDRRVAS